MDTLKSLAIIALASAAATALGFAAGARWALPLLGAAAFFPPWVSELSAGRPARAAGYALWWALALSACTAAATAIAPERAAEAVFRGPEYAAEMMRWIRTGEGAEGSPSLFLPQHALHFVLFNAACLLSGGLGGLVMGAVLLNYMNYYVAQLALTAASPAAAAALGWPPWAVMRVAGFVLTAVPLSAALLSKRKCWRSAGSGRYFKYYVWGLSLVVLDAVLKAVLAPHWRGFLLKTL